MKFQPILLIVIFTTIALFGLEGLLRLTLDPDQLYIAEQTQPALRSWRKEVQFWQSHVQQLPDENGFDPTLGWDIERSGDRIRGVAPISLSKPTGASRIVSIGDSFTFGLDAGEAQNFSALLNQREDL